MKKWIYNFGPDHSNELVDKNILGGKGAGLAMMSKLGMPVPPGFTIITETCADYYNNNSISGEVWGQIQEAIKNLAVQMGKGFGDDKNPLLVSVRSGARVSMPGMMDTILNLGLNDLTVEGLAKITRDRRFAYDSYRRFIEMYASVVMGIDHYLFDSRFSYIKQQHNLIHDWELSPEVLQQVIVEYKNIIVSNSKKSLPQDVWEQLRQAIYSVFESWNSSRAIKYRSLNNIPNNWGTAINVQAMVFGNMGDDSLTGVLFTRNPSEGTNKLFGEFLVNAQGEDLVAGLRTPQQITLLGRKSVNSSDLSLEELKPEVFKELSSLALQLENHFRDMQDIEFTVEQGKIWLLQTRSGKRTAKAAVKIAIDMVSENLIDPKEVLQRITSSHIEKLLHNTIDDKVKIDVIAKGLPASPGAASGVVVFNSDDAEKFSKIHRVILVRRETSPEDIGGMAVAEGILTTKGGMTSHAAVVARGMGKPCICGASDIIIDEASNFMVAGQTKINSGEMITINGATGEIIKGEVATVRQAMFPEFIKLMEIADDIKRMSIRANAETLKDAKTSREFRSDGIGLCRTEHMFFAPERIAAMREMIFASSNHDRNEALEKLLPFQIKDFQGLFEMMGSLPITIRLLDPPLHEFLPSTAHDIENFAKHIGLNFAEVNDRIKQLSEVNPMLGHRGSRLAITFPEIYEMQVKAIFQAAVAIKKEKGITVVPEIMIPFIFDVSEVIILKELIAKVHEHYHEIDYLFGVMIELPRAALQAHKIAPIIDFCSFGTNDLTQTTMGVSRDDAGKFLSYYQDKKIIPVDPFVSIDQVGVGELIKIAIERIKNTNPKVKIGVCGEHGGDPESIAFFEKAGLDYVSCSPYRIPVARVAAAYAVI